MPHSAPFTKRKFLSFSIPHRHKKCAELLRSAYLTSSTDRLKRYNELLDWMNGDGISSLDFEGVSKRYHEHVSLSGCTLSEHRLLPDIKKSDRSSPLFPIWPITLYLDDLRSAHNVGSILRTVEAFSLGEVVFSPSTPFADHPQVKKTSMGSSAFVQCKVFESFSHLPQPLIVMETVEGATPLFEFTFPEAFTLAVGNEEFGCSKILLEKADFLIQIPMRGRKNSLNVANALAVAAAEIARQFSYRNKENNA